MLNKRNITLLIPILLVISFPIWKTPLANFLSPRGANENAAETQNDHVSNDFSMDKVKILQNQDGKKTAVIRAESAKSGGNANELFLNKVDADILDKDDNITNVVAQQGTYNVETEMLDLKKDVVIKREEGKQVMYSDHLLYSDKDRTVISPGTTRFVGPEFDIIGGMMEYDIKKDSYRLSKRVKCVIGGLLQTD